MSAADILKSFKAVGRRVRKRAGLRPHGARPSQKPPRGFPSSPLHGALVAALSNRRRLNVLVVGANDGKINDPSWEFSHRFPDRVNIALVEPQPNLIPYLEQNYRSFPSAKIFNVAVADSPELTLYGVKAEYWPQLQVHYATKRGWPVWRAPTGVTSTDRAHVEEWLKKIDVPKGIALDALIEEMVIPARPLAEVIDEAGFSGDLDLLQIDVEGGDAEVVASSLASGTRPCLIYFEANNTPSGWARPLFDELGAAGYHVFPTGRDVLCVLDDSAEATETGVLRRK